MKHIATLVMFMFAITYELCLAGSPDVTPNYTIGVYYFPGWLDSQKGLNDKAPWERIRQFPELEPLLGYYQEGDVAVAEQQIEWMKAYGIDYIAYDWYWDGKKPLLGHALDAFLKAGNSKELKFSLLWANHTPFPQNINQFTLMIRYWTQNYFQKNNYLMLDGKPVVFVFSPQRLEENAKGFGNTTKRLFMEANAIAKEEGFGGIYFIESTPAIQYLANDLGVRSGYSAYSTYNYDRGFAGVYDAQIRASHSYHELDAAYQQNWDWILENSPLPYVLPLISGWDKRPWGGSSDPLHDYSYSTPDEFESHLTAAKARLDKYPSKTNNRMAVICCWNEFGEGSYIEPTKAQGFSYLEKVRKVFGAH